MYFQFLIEDRSGAELIRILMDSVKHRYPNVDYKCKPFHGIGKIPGGLKVHEVKKGTLLADLPAYLKGFDKSLQGIAAAIVVVLDNDDSDTAILRMELQEIIRKHGISVDCVFCIAIEEMEAWLLGDPIAVKTAYPKAVDHILDTYQQDSICGTWERLADAVYPGGYKKLKKECSSYEIGGMKFTWAHEIGQHMQIERNQSPSFQDFIGEIQKRLPGVVC